MTNKPHNYIGLAAFLSALVSMPTWIWIASYVDHITPHGWWSFPLDSTMLMLSFVSWAALAFWFNNILEESSDK